MSRFFIKGLEKDKKTVLITGEDVTHIKNVLRLKSGDRITLCDCAGYDYQVEIQKIGQDGVETRVLDIQENMTEPPIKVAIFQGIPKSDKMDWIIQKCVELGAERIVPVVTDRTVVKFKDTRDAEHKVSRWQRISQEASKQCDRGVIPPIEAPIDFSQALKASEEYDLCMIPYEKETGKGLKQYIKEGNHKSIAVFIGPEGGFTEDEVARASSFNIYPVTLGKRILRTETAGIAVLSILMYELGDMGL